MLQISVKIIILKEWVSFILYTVHLVSRRCSRWLNPSWIDPVTVSKIFILGSSYKKELLKQIPIENLPVKYGGTSVLHNPNDKFYYSDIGPWRDPRYIGPEGEIPNIFGKFTVTS